MADQKILIIGSGFAAAANLIHLVEAGIKPSQITIVGPGQLGMGNAYGCNDDDFRLNVRANLMWIWPDRRDDFGNWAKTHIKGDKDAVRSSGMFYRRRDFGRYVASCVDAALTVSGGQDNALTHYPQIVIKLGKIDQGGWQVECSDGRLIKADLVLLATGNPPPQWPCPIHGAKAQLPDHENRLVQNPWNGRWLDHIPTQSRLAIIGGGLTALDAVTALARRDHHGPIFLLAPHGSLPPEQADWVKQAPPSWPDAPRPSKILRRFRSYLPDLPPEDSVWQQAFEELRIDINQRWQALSDCDQRRLIRRLGWLWSRYRYRAAPQTIAAANRLQQTGILEICHARLGAIHLEMAGDDVSLRLYLHDAKTGARQLAVDHVINCTGVGHDPLLANLVTDGIGLPDAFGQGLRVNHQNEVINPEGQAIPTLLLVGPAMASSLGDVVAASEISLASMRVAARLANQVR